MEEFSILLVLILLLGIFVLILLYLFRNTQNEKSNSPKQDSTAEGKKYAIDYLARKYNTEIIKKAKSVLDHYGLGGDVEKLSIIYISAFYLIPPDKHEGELATTANKLFFDTLKEVYNTPVAISLEKFYSAMDIMDDWTLQANLYLDSKYDTNLNKLYIEKRSSLYLSVLVLALALELPCDRNAGDELIALYDYVKTREW